MAVKGRCAVINYYYDKLNLTVLPEKLGVGRLNRSELFPAWLSGEDHFYSITGTYDEISIVCRESLIPDHIKSEKGFRAIKVEGPLAFELTGVLSALLDPLTEAGISVFVISTYDTDYILVKEQTLKQALDILSDRCNIT